jgi:hypothetical protein
VHGFAGPAFLGAQFELELLASGPGLDGQGERVGLLFLFVFGRRDVERHRFRPRLHVALHRQPGGVFSRLGDIDFGLFGGVFGFGCAVHQHFHMC